MKTAVKASTVRRRANEKAAKRARRQWREIKGVWPAVDELFLDWIRTLPCFVCFLKHHSWDMWIANIGFKRAVFGERGHEWNDETQSITQAAHLGAIRGMRQKASDRTAGPLCGDHHDRGKPEGHHVLGKRFFDYHGLDRELIIEALNAAWQVGPNDV